MRELSVIIKIIPLNNMRMESYSVMTSNYFSFQPLLSSSDAGIIYICDIDINIDNPDNEIMKDFSIMRSCIVQFTDSFGNKINIGTKDYPAKVIISPNLNSSSLKIKCSMPISPLL